MAESSTRQGERPARTTTLEKAELNAIRGGQLIRRFQDRMSSFIQQHPHITNVPRRDRIRLPNQPDLERNAQNALSYDRELWYEDRRLALAVWAYQQHPSARVFLGGNIELYQGLRLLLSLTIGTAEIEERPWVFTIQPRVQTALALLIKTFESLSDLSAEETSLQRSLADRLRSCSAGHSYAMSHAEALLLDQAISDVFLHCPTKHTSVDSS